MKDLVLVAEIEWTEFESGWGQRPDGFQYFSTHADAQAYRDRYIDKMPLDTPYEYSLPGEISMVQVDPVFALLIAKDGMLWTRKSCRVNS